VSRTVVQYIQDILREVRGQATASEARQALQNSINYVDSKGNWEFLLKSAALSIEPPYRTGTVSITAGTTAVTSSGATWSTLWKYRDILFSTREMPYAIASFPTASTATLAAAISGTASIVTGTYVIYQARYALPADCEPGRDFFIRGPNGSGPKGDGIITKLGRLSFEHKVNWQTSGQVLHYTDDEFDETARTATIRLWPYPSGSAGYYLCYYKKMTVPTADADYVMVPEAFEKMLINRAACEIMRSKAMPGWVGLSQDAEGMMRALHGRFTASAGYDQSLQVTDDENPLYAESDLLYVRGWRG
jgi:hypothetical protein